VSSFKLRAHCLQNKLKEKGMVKRGQTLNQQTKHRAICSVSVPLVDKNQQSITCHITVGVPKHGGIKNFIFRHLNSTEAESVMLVTVTPELHYFFHKYFK
jgi:hypothetical protein